jgi:hypothetical protein
MAVTCLKEKRANTEKKKQVFHHMIPTAEEEREAAAAAQEAYVTVPKSVKNIESRSCKQLPECMGLAELQRSHVFVVIPPISSAGR